MNIFDYQGFFVLTLLPLVATLVLERFFIFKLGQSPALQAWCSKRRWLEPNMISLARCFMGFGSVLIYHYVGKIWGVYCFGFWIISDITDGSLARILNKKSSEGEMMDPLSDKFLYFPPLFYASSLSYLSFHLVLLYLVLDAFGQVIRYFPFVKGKQANLFGKGKTFLTTVLLCFIYLQDTYAQKMLFDINDLLLVTVIILAINSFLFRSIPNYWYANILSLSNLACGLAGIALFFFGYPLFFTFLLVFVGQILDLYDGRAAEKWGSTPRGEIFDDLADGTNFGLSIGCIVFASFQQFWVALGLALLYACCTIYRLIRFLKDKKKADVSSGVEVFNGFPSPAGALLVGSALLILNNPLLFPDQASSIELWKALVVVLSSLLMVSHLSYIHFGRMVLAKLSLLVRIPIYTFLIVFVLVTIRLKNSLAFVSLVFLIVFLYALFGNRLFQQAFAKLRRR